MRFFAPLFIATVLVAQTTSEPEIAGSVTEVGTDAPISAAEVELREFVLVEGLVTPKVFATVLTNSRGEFSFKPGHIGNFYIEVKKIGYDDATLSVGAPSAERQLTLTDQNQKLPVKLQLMRPGEITGRVVDVGGESIADLRVTMETPGQIAAAFQTDNNGEFRVSVAPGPYVIQTASRTGIDLKPRDGPNPNWQQMATYLDYTEEAFKIVEEGYESLYWPGGVSTSDSALPIQVAPGAVGNFGTLTVRKVPKYRAHISVDRECVAGESRALVVVPLPTSKLPSSFLASNCEKEFLIRGLERGNHLLTTWSKHQWGEVQLAITDHNIAANLRMSSSVDVGGRVLAPEGVKLTSLGLIGILLTSNQRPLVGPPVAIDAEGKFVFKDVLWKEQTITITPQNPDTYVKQIRYGGIPLSGSTFDTSTGSTIEVLLDSGAASISGTVTQAGKPTRALVYVARWPLDAQQYLRNLRPASENGKFVASSLTPGEYRAVAFPAVTIAPAALERALTEGTRVKVERGEQKTIELNLAEPR